MIPEISQFAILFGLAAVLGMLARLVRQPLILAYLVAGVLIGFFHLVPLAGNPLYDTFSGLGVMFLLFLIGLEINFPSLRLVGGAAAVIALGQITFTFVGGFLLALFLHFDYLPATYIALALTFSSTIIVIKLLSEKKDLNSLYGRLTVGVMLIQDFVAILILLTLSGLQAGEGMVWSQTILRVFEGLLLFSLTLGLGRTLLPKIFSRFGKSQELLFVASLAWLFLVVTVVKRWGFSIEIGGFLAGLALANSAEHFQIGSRVKPLRDFFLLLFFIVLGSTLGLAQLGGQAWPIILLSLFVLLGNPLIVLVIMGSMGYHRRTSFLTGLTIGQISEFSLVLVALGLKLGHVSQSLVTLVTAVAVVTIAWSSFLIMEADRLYLWLEKTLRWFERSKPKDEPKLSARIAKPIILIGAHRTGQNILAHLKKSDVAVIDFDPDVIAALRRRGYTTLYGDLTDPDLIEQIVWDRAKVIISTSPDVENNLYFLGQLHWRPGHRPSILMRASTVADSRALYQAGADYVLLPTLTSGQFLGHILHGRYSPKTFHQLRQADQKRLEETVVL